LPPSPYAALLDLVLAVARTGGTREAVIALLRSSLLTVRGRRARDSPRDEVSTLETVLLDRRASGDGRGLGGRSTPSSETARRAIVWCADGARRAASGGGVAAALTRLRAATSASQQVAHTCRCAARARAPGPS
jgi:hypothetical protein